MFVSSACCPLSCPSTQTAVPLVRIEFDKYVDYIEEDTVWLCHCEGQQGREDEVEDVGVYLTERKGEEKMRKIYVVT
jgi:hypothetical protein